MCGSLHRTIGRSALGHPVPDCPPEPFDFMRNRSLPSAAARHPEPAMLTILTWTTGSDGLEASYGATIEQWRTPADAKARMDYIQGILKDMPVSGIQYDYLRAAYS